jgi:hypothetical protein
LKEKKKKRKKEKKALDASIINVYGSKSPNYLSFPQRALPSYRYEALSKSKHFVCLTLHGVIVYV